jgi:hypothetical protein
MVMEMAATSGRAEEDVVVSRGRCGYQKEPEITAEPQFLI